MTRTNDPNTSGGRAMDAFDVWRLFQNANIEIWARGMAEMLTTPTFSHSMTAYLDHYLTASVPLQKMFDYYMSMWLAQVNMPSREDTSRLERQLANADQRVGDLYQRIDEVAAMLKQQLAPTQEQHRDAPPPPPPAFPADSSERLARIETHLQALDARTRSLLEQMQALQQHLAEAAAAAANASASSSSASSTATRSRKRTTRKANDSTESSQNENT